METDMTKPFGSASIEQVKLAAEVRISDYLSKRLDLRGSTVIAFDDNGNRDCAYSISKTSDGFKLGVHIIDADEYIPSGSPVDIEARERFMEFNYHGIIMHMLPPKFIESVCSYVEGEDKLAVSIFFDIDEYGTCKDINIEKSVVRAPIVCIFEEIDDIYRSKDTSLVVALKQKYASYLPQIDLLYDLSARLNMVRRRKGAAVYARYDSVPVRDEGGRIVALQRVEDTRDSNLMVSEFTLFTGETLGKYFASKNLPIVFTACKTIDPAKLAEIARFIGYDEYDAQKPDYLTQQELAHNIFLNVGFGMLAAKFCDLIPPVYFADSPEPNYSVGIDHYMRCCHPTKSYTDIIQLRVIKQWIDSDCLLSNIDINRYKRSAKAFADEFNQKQAEVTEIKKSIRRKDLDELLQNVDSFSAYYLGGEKPYILLDCGATGVLSSDPALHVLTRIRVKLTDRQTMTFCSM